MSLRTSKCVWTLNIDNYAPAITEITYPWLRHFANKIGADFKVLTKRRFPGWPTVYEKLQLHELGRDYDWNIYVDGDAIVHPDIFDPTNHLPMDTVAHNGSDVASSRWYYDEYFLRDGRHISSCNWFTVASRWCLDLWRPLEIPFNEAVKNIHPYNLELACGITASHLIDDYALSRNIARFGLKFKAIRDIQFDLRLAATTLFFHHYTIPEAEKLLKIKEFLSQYKLNPPRIWIPPEPC